MNRTHEMTKGLRLHILLAIDKTMDKRVQETGTTCTKGCDACCSQPIYVTEPEGLLIAEELLHDMPRLKEALPRLKAEALYGQQFGPIPGDDFCGMDRYAYWDGRHPCAFLDKEAHLCTIYPIRPVACRVWFVKSDPKLCNLDAKSIVDVIDAGDVMEASLVFAHSVGRGRIAPFANVVLWMLREIAPMTNNMYSEIRVATEGVVTPKDWWGVVIPLPKPP